MSKDTSYDIRFEDNASSFIRGFTYSAADGALTVDFKNEKSYRYESVPHQIIDQFLLAESKGKFLQENIKNKYVGGQIDN